MRLDGILENVDAITGSAASATEAVDTVANAPLKIVNAASEKLRGAFCAKKASDESAKLAAAGEAAGAVEFVAAAAPVGQMSESAASPVAQVAAAQPETELQPEPETAGGYFTYAAKED